MSGISKPIKNSGQHQTIGLLIDSTIQSYQQAIWRGVVKQANLSNVNLVSFNIASHDIGGTNRELSQIIELINKDNIQGLIFVPTTFLDIISLDTFNEFLRGFQPMPLVSIGIDVAEIPSMVIDNYSGMRSVIDHLIEVHEFHRIAYLQMIKEYPEAKECYQAYTDSLADHNIPLNPDLILPVEYIDNADKVVNKLLDDRKVKFDAIVATNDDMASDLMYNLQARGYKIPEDIAISGFDDQENSRYLSPPLTTVRQPLNNLGKQAVKLLLSQINGEQITTNIFPTELIVRQSCGCMHRYFDQSLILTSQEDNSVGIPGLISFKEEIIDEILGTTNSPGHYFQIVSELFDVLIETITDKSPELFFRQLRQKSEVLTNFEYDIFNWHLAISILYRHVLKAISKIELVTFVEYLFHQAQILISETDQRQQANLRIKTIREANSFRTFSQRLSTITNQTDLFDMLTLELPNLGVPSCFLVIKEQFRTEAKQKQLLLAFTSQKRYPLPKHGIPLNDGDFPQVKYFPKDCQYNFIVENIKYQNQDIGYILMEANSTDGSLYRGIADQISSAIENILLVQQVEDRANKLVTAAEISRVANSILEPEELMREAVELIKDRFNLYYVGLFLIDKISLWAELIAGTGESGATMIAQNWRLEAGGSSMIGRCISTGEADVQLDVDKAPVHLRNPYLPNTKSELALPLISRGSILGALTIQSETKNAFSNEDISALQTMADQVATSIANAQLFEQTQTALLDTETLLNVSRFTGTSTEFNVYINQVLDLTLKSTGIDNGLISIYNTQTKQLEIAAHQIPDSLFTALQKNGLEGTLCDLVYQHRNAVIVHNLAEDSPVDATGLINLGFNSYQGVPLEARGKIFGTLCTFSKSTIQTKETRVALLQAIGQQVAASIENMLLIEQTQDALAKTKKQSQRLAALNALSEKLTHAESVESVFQASSSAIPQIIESDYLSYSQIKEDSRYAEIMFVSEENGLIPSNRVLRIEDGPIEVAIRSKNPIIVENTSQTIPNHAESLPSLDQRSFLIVPIVVSNEAVGTFNFGCSEPYGFSEQDRDLMVQLGSALSNTIENLNLLQKTQETLAELEATQQRYQIQAWSTYNKNRGIRGYRRTLNSTEPLGMEKIPEIEQAIQKKAPIVTLDEENLELTIPIILRDQPIGAIGLQANPEKRQWTVEEIALVQEISEQFALAAESLRLLDETQQRAARERLVAEITTKIRASNDPQTMIQTAAQELNAALQTKRTQISFQQNERPLTRGEE